MPLPTEPLATGPLVAADIGPGAQGIVAGFQNDWDDAVRKTAGVYAWSQTMIAELGEDLFFSLIGPSAEGLRDLANRFRRLDAATRKLASGEAVLVAYRQGADPKVYLGIYKASAARGNLGAGPFVYFALAAGTVLTGAYLYFHNFAQSVVKFRADSEREALGLVKSMAAGVERIAQADPQAAARIAEANAKALEAARMAQADPDSWIDKLTGAVGGGIDSLLNSPLVWAALAFWWTQRGKA